MQKFASLPGGYIHEPAGKSDIGVNPRIRGVPRGDDFSGLYGHQALFTYIRPCPRGVDTSRQDVGARGGLWHHNVVDLFHRNRMDHIRQPKYAVDAQGPEEAVVERIEIFEDYSFPFDRLNDW